MYACCWHSSSYKDLELLSVIGFVFYADRANCTTEQVGMDSAAETKHHVLLLVGCCLSRFADKQRVMHVCHNGGTEQMIAAAQKEPDDFAAAVDAVVSRAAASAAPAAAAAASSSSSSSSSHSNLMRRFGLGFALNPRTQKPEMQAVEGRVLPGPSLVYGCREGQEDALPAITSSGITAESRGFPEHLRLAELWKHYCKHQTVLLSAQCCDLSYGQSPQDVAWGGPATCQCTDGPRVVNWTGSAGFAELVLVAAAWMTKNKFVLQCHAPVALIISLGRLQW
jgi:hypothetical protein